MDLKNKRKIKTGLLFIYSPLGNTEAAGKGQKRRRRIVSPSPSSSESQTSSDSDDDPDDSDEEERAEPPPKKKKFSSKGNQLTWNEKQMANLRKNFRCLANIDDDILRHLSWKDIQDTAARSEKTGKGLTERLAANFDTVGGFPVRVEAGEDDCTGLVHSSRFLRGYVGNSQVLWQQAKAAQGRTGLPPIGNYETVTIGLNGSISCRVWHEVHNPSSKVLSIRLLSNSAMKSGWHEREKAGEIFDFESLQELKMAVVALEACVHKVMPWNFSVATIAIFLHSVGFGEVELAGKPNSLSFLSDFIDEVLRHNAQAWDEGRHFMSNMEVGAKWSAMLLRRFSAPAVNNRRRESDRISRSNNVGGPVQEPRAPKGLCRQFQEGRCRHPGDKHSSHWDANIVLNHKCAKWLPDQNRFCLESHSKSAHK